MRQLRESTCSSAIALAYSDTTFSSHNTLTLEIVHQLSPVSKAWQELADQALDFHLRPARAVVQSLEDNCA
jgi:hypothetical protein